MSIRELKYKLRQKYNEWRGKRYSKKIAKITKVFQEISFKDLLPEVDKGQKPENNPRPFNIDKSDYNRYYRFSILRQELPRKNEEFLRLQTYFSTKTILKDEYKRSYFIGETGNKIFINDS